MKKPIIFFLHLGFWLVYLLLMLALVLLLSTGVEAEEQLDEDLLALVFFCILFLPALATFYSFYGILFPRFFRRQRFVQTVVYGGGAAVVATLLGFVLFWYACACSCGQDPEDGSFVGIVALISIPNMLCGWGAIVIKGFVTWFEEVKQKETLLRKNHAMELALVKSQLDPHFLFNTINNIDVLILKDADEASNYLNRLSDIMRFMLYETKTDEIPLSKELEYIEKYVALQKIRTANADYVNFSVQGDPMDKTIAPMVFIPFIENAFKHATNKKQENAINIRLTTTAESTELCCMNRYDSHKANRFKNNGLGNDLIKKRLKLIYPKRHWLSVKKGDEIYEVKLRIAYG